MSLAVTLSWIVPSLRPDQWSISAWRMVGEGFGDGWNGRGWGKTERQQIHFKIKYCTGVPCTNLSGTGTAYPLEIRLVAIYFTGYATVRVSAVI